MNNSHLINEYFSINFIVIDDNATLSRETIVNVWKNDQYKEALSRVLQFIYLKLNKQTNVLKIAFTDYQVGLPCYIVFAVVFEQNILRYRLGKILHR